MKKRAKVLICCIIMVSLLLSGSLSIIAFGSTVELTEFTVYEEYGQTSFNVGETFSMEGIMLVASYSDGSTAIIDVSDPGISVTIPSLSTAGIKTVTVNYTYTGDKRTVLSDSYIISVGNLYGYIGEAEGVSDVDNNGSYDFVAVGSSFSSSTKMDSLIESRYLCSSYYTEYIDLTFYNNDVEIDKTSKIQEIKITLDEYSNKKQNLNIFKVSRKGNKSILTRSSSKSADNWKVSGKIITMYVQESGTYAIVYTDSTSKIKTVKFNNFPTTDNEFPDLYVESGESVPDPGEAYRNGDTFLGWYQNESKFNFTKAITSDTTLSAKWQSGWNNVTNNSETSSVSKKLSYIKLVADPIKNYNVGEVFSFNGIVNAVYSDNSESFIPNTSLIVTGGDTSNAGTKTIDISYTENGVSASTSYQITIYGLPEVKPYTPDTYFRKLKGSKNKATVYWYWDNNATGYRIQYSTDNSFKNTKKRTVKSPKNHLTIKNLTKGNTYYFRIRSFVKKDGKTYFGAWSNTKKVRIK